MLMRGGGCGQSCGDLPKVSQDRERGLRRFGTEGCLQRTLLRERHVSVPALWPPAQPQPCFWPAAAQPPAHGSPGVPTHDPPLKLEVGSPPLTWGAQPLCLSFRVC